MKDLSLQQGIDNSDADFLNGKIKDHETLVGEGVNQDPIQFFQKLMNLAGLTPNGNEDNEANGYQLIEALKKTLQIQEDWIDATLISGQGWDDTTNVESKLRYFKDNAGNVHLWCNKLPNTAGALIGSVLELWDPPTGYVPSMADGNDINLVYWDAFSVNGTTVKEHKIYFRSGGLYNKFYFQPSPDALPANALSNPSIDSLGFYIVYGTGN